MALSLVIRLPLIADDQIAQFLANFQIELARATVRIAAQLTFTVKELVPVRTGKLRKSVTVLPQVKTLGATYGVVAEFYWLFVDRHYKARYRAGILATAVSINSSFIRGEIQAAAYRALSRI